MLTWWWPGSFLADAAAKFGDGATLENWLHGFVESSVAQFELSAAFERDESLERSATARPGELPGVSARFGPPVAAPFVAAPRA